MHIAAELNKSFKQSRPVPTALGKRLREQPGGEFIAENLQEGLPSFVLGSNPSLLTAIDNDNPQCFLYFAQELYALAKPGDALFAISTSGRSRSIQQALSIARIRGVKTILLTGPADSPLRKVVDISIPAPGKDTAEVQEWHIRIYHALCEFLEQVFFGEGRGK